MVQICYKVTVWVFVLGIAGLQPYSVVRAQTHESELFTLIEQGNISKIKKWLKQSDDPNIDHKWVQDNNIYYLDPLSYAVGLRQTEVIAFWLEEKNHAMLSKWDLWLARAVGEAALYADSATLQLLLEQGANVNKPCVRCRDINPIAIAVMSQKPELYRMLLKAGAQTEETGALHILHAAAWAGDTLLMSEWLQNPNIDANMQSKEGYIPLWYALINRHYEAARWLVKKGADPMFYSHKGETLMNAAFRTGKSESVNWVLEHIDTFMALEGSPENPLIFEAILYLPYNQVMALVELGLQVNMMDLKSRTPLFLLVNPEIPNRKEYLTLFQEEYIDPNHPDGYNKTVMDYAQENKDKELIKLLKSYVLLEP